MKKKTLISWVEFISFYERESMGMREHTRLGTVGRPELLLARKETNYSLRLHSPGSFTSKTDIFCTICLLIFT